MFDSVEQNLNDGWRFYDPHVAPPEFLEWLARWTAFTIDLDWPEAQKRALDQARRRPLSDPRHQARPDAVPQAVHRPRAGHQREHLAVQGLPRRGRGRRERRAHRARLGGPAAGRSRALLRRDDADQVRGRHARDGDPDPSDHPAREAGAHALLPAVHRGEGRGRASRVLRDRPALWHRHRRRSRRSDRRGRPKKTSNERASPGIQAHQLLQGVPHHREGLERRRALPHRQAPAAQPDDALAGHRLRLRRRPARHRARARRPLRRGAAGLRDRRHGQRPHDLRRDDQEHQPRGVQAPADDLHRAALLRGAHRLHRVQGEPRVQGPPPRARVVQGRALADRARHHARGRARAHPPREGRQPHPRRARSGRTRAPNEIDMRFVPRGGVAGSMLPRRLRLRLENLLQPGPSRRARVHAARRDRRRTTSCRRATRR